MVAAVTAPPVGPGDLDALMRCLLPTTPMQTPPPRSIPTEMEILLERLQSGALAPTPTLPPQTGIMGMETLLHFPERQFRTRGHDRVRLARTNWTTIVCFSCVKPGHGVGRWPELDETFPYMLPGWSAEKVDANYMMVSPHVAAERRRAENGN